MRSKLFVMGAVASFAAMGCTVTPSADGPDAEVTASAATAIVVVERTSGPGDAVRDDAVVARFVRVQKGEVDDQALRIAGAAQDIPALGSCEAARPAPPDLQPRAVELLDVGPVSVDDAQGRSTLLLPRTMPDPAGIVSGVIYSARSTDAFQPSSGLQLHASGGPDLPDGFDVSIDTPQELVDVSATPTPSGLDVAWEASEADPRDTVYVEVLSKEAHVLVRCASPDAGHTVVPMRALGGLDEGQVAVHRLHTEPFHAKGVEPGEVRFDVTRVVAFHR